MTRYYRSIDELNAPAATEEVDDGRNEVDRRDFLKLAGFSLAAVGATACSRPVVSQAIPYLMAPEEIVPGRAYFMASTCHGCAARCGILVKCRDGRPIKIEGNPDHPLSRGGVCAAGQAMVLGLYDSHRLAAPLLRVIPSAAEREESGRGTGGRPDSSPSSRLGMTDWAAIDAFVAQKLAKAKRVRVVSSTLASPTTKRVIDEFLARFEDGKYLVYDVPSCSAIADAHEQTHGVRAVPHYRFDKADVVVSIDADFLGTWISPVEFTKQRSAHRAWHAQLEPRMSITGSNADQRLRIDPRDIGAILSHLAGAGSYKPQILDRIVQRLRAASGKSLVVCGSNRIEDQLLVNHINESLGSYGTTIDIDAPSHQREGSGAALDFSGVDAAFFLGCNPVYDRNDVDIANVPLVVTFASHPDETSKFAHAICPDHHPLESWSDSEPVAGVYAVTQPAIAPLRNTRSAIESFATWSGKPAKAYDLIRNAFQGNWDQTLNDGFAISAPSPRTSGEKVAEGRMRGGPSPALAPLAVPLPASRGEGAGYSLVLYPTVAMLDGRHAHNAWLHELPDPITKITWDNVACLSPDTAKKLDVRDGDIVRVNDVELPAFIQPGQHDNVVAIAIGYGRMGTDRFAKIGPQWLLRRTYVHPGEAIGKRVVQLPETVKLAKTNKHVDLATTQLHNSMEGRPLVRPAAGNRQPAATLWPNKQNGEHRWAMAVDLAKCTGCSACVIACQAENNVPVVGRDEVVREREMHWIRIDRYYSGEGDDVEAVHQPMMCAHCGNAPCESVCPVLATVHSSDGLNQQVYNRCVGTRYCANNCPYKVRRFNWFDYPHDDRLANLVLNPDVAVRSRGVMEKCSMCTQRIEEARIEAKQKGVRIADGAIRMACEQSCPADAIVFGDLNDPKSRIGRARRDPRHFRLLEELNVDPAVG